MGKVSVVPVPGEVPGNASREVFQSLFKDLGKQAMALEFILRAVCGRVDKMENWLTEVSFGMTELDLKLRNIAHNIDGTAAVDDEAQGPHRWAIPPPDDVKPLAPTVSKKLGNDKKAVRVTGMAAAILDRLATTSSAATPTSAETEKGERSNSKKKVKDKKHNNKKVKANEPAATPLPPVAERVELSESKVPTPLPAPQNVPVPAKSVVVEPELMTRIPETLTKPVEQVTAAHLNVAGESHQVTIELPAGEVPLATNEVRSEAVDVHEKIEPLATVKPEIQDPAPSQGDQAMKESAISALESDVPNGQSSTRESSDVMPEKIIESSVGVEEARSTDEIKSESQLEVTRDTVERLPTDETADTETSILEDNVSPAPQILHTLVENAATEPVALMTPVVEKQTSSTGNTPSSTTRTTGTESTSQPINKTPPIRTASVSSVLPTVQVERTIEPFVLKAPPQPTINTSSALAAASTSELQATPMKPAPMETPSALNEEKMEEKLVSSSKSTEQKNSSPPAHHSTTAATQPLATAVTRTIKTVGIPIRAFTTTHHEKAEPPHHSEVVEPIADPLLPRRTSAQRRSSKMVPRTSLTKKYEMSEDDAARRLSANSRGLHARRTSVAPQAKAQEQEEIQMTTPQQVPRVSPAVQPVLPKALVPESSAPTNATEQVEVEQESSDSSSESSSDGSGSSSSDEDLEDDAEAGAAVKDISKTMTALKKLKRAQMLSPEEEKELKERAHKKWFQLKGHIKEKQKKDVTNILLKRKKNVFTVSSRIELLEEKSREIFAALKQMTNEMREKNDRATHETLRRRVTDIEQSLLSVDLRIASLSSPVMDKVSDLESEMVLIRTTVQLQLAAAQSEATARHSLLEQAIASQRTLVEALTQDIPTQLSAQTELFLEKLRQQPDYTAAIENLKRSLRRKADLKLLKELEARLLGLDAENEDCLVRCLSCRKEVTNLNHEKETDLDDQDGPNAGSGPSQLRKVNPGPSSARIYRSNVPFSAQPLVQESILEESADEPKLPRSQTLAQPQPTLFGIAEPEQHQQSQSAGDSHASEKPPAVRVPSVKWSTPPAEAMLKRDVKSAKATPLSLMNITATRAILSPDRPISAPVVPLKKKAPTARSKSLLKSLTPQEQPPQ